MFKKLLSIILIISFFSASAQVAKAESLSDLSLKSGSLNEGEIVGTIEKGIYKSNDRVYFQGSAVYEESCKNETEIISETQYINILKKAVYAKKLNRKTSDATYSWKISFDLSSPSKNICPKGYRSSSPLTLVSKTGKVYLSNSLGALPILDENYNPIEINLP